jgi:diguanylate cyclase (GGDEF)-like protein
MIPFGFFVLDKQEVVYLDEFSKNIFDPQYYDINHAFLFEQFKDASEPLSKNIGLIGRDLRKYTMDVIGQLVRYEDHVNLLIFIRDLRPELSGENDLSRLSKLRDLMLDINQSILHIEDIQKTFYLILENAMRAIEKSNLGSIFILHGDIFNVISYIGFGKDIEDLQLPLVDSFLYRNSNGMMDRITNISRIQNDDHFYPVTTFAGDRVYIKSELSAPIYVNGHLYAMINLDSLEEDAFDESDIASMEFVSTNIQIAVSNQLLYQEKSRMAMFDSLTQLYNRYYFNEQFEQMLLKAKRTNEHFVIALFDVDDLKTTNDVHGHVMGDKVLQKVASDLLEKTRRSDVIARYGGDEFVGLFYNADKEMLLSKLLEIQDEVKLTPIKTHDAVISCSFSFGTACYPDDGSTMAALLEVADQAMYVNKRDKEQS